MLPESINRVVEILMKFPSLGRRSSQKIALQILEQSDVEFEDLITSLEDMKHNVSFCPECGFFSKNNELCEICREPKRSKYQICVVEKPTEVIAMEKSQVYRGVYHILNRLISPLDNVFAQNTSIPNLISRIEKLTDNLSGEDKVELVLFLQPSFNSEATTAYIREKINELRLSQKVNISRMAQGLPSYYNIDTLDQETLIKAIEGRVKIG